MQEIVNYNTFKLNLFLKQILVMHISLQHRESVYSLYLLASWIIKIMVHFISHSSRYCKIAVLLTKTVPKIQQFTLQCWLLPFLKPNNLLHSKIWTYLNLLNVKCSKHGKFQKIISLFLMLPLKKSQWMLVVNWLAR